MGNSDERRGVDSPRRSPPPPHALDQSAGIHQNAVQIEKNRATGEYYSFFHTATTFPTGSLN